jgi:hypothetical protein
MVAARPRGKHRFLSCSIAIADRTKARRATDAGRAQGYPLLFTTEPEE